jgi:hypothetical protein
MITPILYSKLPRDIIDYILCFNPQFIIRKGKLTSILLKEDERYKMLEYITIKPVENPSTYFSYLGMSYISDKRYEYEFHNQYNNVSLERKHHFIDNDSMNVTITIHKNGNIQYRMCIYKLKPKELSNNNRILRFKGNMRDSNWDFIHYQYTRI